MLVYGGLAKRDVANAEHLAGLNTIRLMRLHGGTHNSIQHLLSRGRFTAVYRWLVGEG